ncbi:MAG TPA: D-alanine--D-alanine ligase [Gemmatimonadales bacterium]|nr:D-alanine--D-alanine ligase [Gemmatimonadales bacterium]
MRIVVLTGGATEERAVAFAGAAQIVRALRARGHEVHVVDTVTGLLDEAGERALLAESVGGAPPPVTDLDRRERAMLSNGLAELPVLRGADVVFPCLHGGRGEGGTLQAVLDVLGVPYTGSGALGSALALDKDLSKRLFRAAGVPVPAWFVTPPPVAPEDVTTALGWPVIVKPARQGSTVGLTLVKHAKDLDAAVALARQHDAEVLVEQFIPGREFTVGVLGDVPLPVGEIIPKHEIFDYECKYTPGMTEELFPAPIDTALARQLQEMALTAHRALKLGGYSRIDFRVNPEGDIFCLEANSLPGMTRLSLFPQAARAAGLEYGEMCERICALALGRNNSRGAGG